jgi:hypothetical protein
VFGVILAGLLALFIVLGFLNTISTQEATIITTPLGIVSAIFTAYVAYIYKEANKRTWNKTDELWVTLKDTTIKIVGYLKQMHMIARASEVLSGPDSSNSKSYAAIIKQCVPRAHEPELKEKADSGRIRLVVMYGEWMIASFPELFKDNSDLVKNIRSLSMPAEKKIDTKKANQLCEDLIFPAKRTFVPIF